MIHVRFLSQKLKRQTDLAIECFHYLVCCGDKSSTKVALKLWNMARKNALLSQKQLVMRFFAVSC